MKNRLVALSMCLMLCSGVTLTPMQMAEAQYGQSPNVPMIKSTIAQNVTHVELTLGKAQVIHLNQPATRVSVSDPDVVGMILLSPTEVELIGKSVGVANLLVWSERSGQSYLSIDLSVHRDVTTLARKIQLIDPGINILPVPAEDSVILTGVAESNEKAQLAYDLAKAFFTRQTAGAAPGGGTETAATSSNSAGSASFAGSSTKILNLIRVIGQPSTKAEMVQERLQEIDPNIKLNVVPGFGGREKAILSGRVQNASMVSRAVNLTSVFYGTPGIRVVTGPGGNVVQESSEDSSGNLSFKARDSAGLIGNLSGNVLQGSIITDTSGNVISMLEVEERPQIRCTIKFMEVRKEHRRDFGASTMLAGNDVKASSFAAVDAAGNSAARLSTGGVFRQVAGSDSAQMAALFGRDLVTIINGLVRDGHARVLAEPTITTISGEPATFLAGGEFPVPVSNVNGMITVTYREFGIRLNILPTVTDRGTIHMQVSPEVSSLDPAAGVVISGFTIPGLRSRKSQTVVEMRNGDNFVLSGLYNQDMTDTYLKTPILGQIPILGALFRSRAFRDAETEMIIVIHPEIQSGMNLSYTKPQSEARQITRLQPEEVYKEMKGVQTAPAPATTATNNNKFFEEDPVVPQAQPNKATAVALARNLSTGTSGKPSPVADDTESNPKKLIKALKQQQKEAKRLSRKVESGKISQTNTSPATSAVRVEQPKASESPVKSTVAGAAAPVSTVVTTAAASAPSVPVDDYLNDMKRELAKLIRSLEQTIGDTSLLMAPDKSEAAQKVQSEPTKTQRQSAAPVVEKPKPVTQPETSSKPAVKAEPKAVVQPEKAVNIQPKVQAPAKEVKVVTQMVSQPRNSGQEAPKVTLIPDMEALKKLIPQIMGFITQE